MVLTDGLDNKSQRNAQEVIDLLQRDRKGYSIKVFTIAFGGDADVNLLQEIAQAPERRITSANRQNVVASNVSIRILQRSSNAVF